MSEEFEELRGYIRDSNRKIEELKELHNHQAENDQIVFIEVYKMINELKERLEEIFKSIHGIEPIFEEEEIWGDEPREDEPIKVCSTCGNNCEDSEPCNSCNTLYIKWKPIEERLPDATGVVVKREDLYKETFSYHIRLFSPERHFTIFCKEILPTGQYTINIEERVRGATRIKEEYNL